MAEESSFFNSVDGDRQYDMEQFATYFNQFLSTGLYHTNNSPALRVSKGAGMTTIMDTGSAYIEGYMYRNTETITFNHGLADVTNPRIDRIVLRLDRGVNVRAINAVVKMGTPSLNPQPPALERNDIVYEISIAQVRINAGVNAIYSVKDERLDPSVAGLVSSLITVPYDQFMDDWNAFMLEVNSFKDSNEQEWSTWMEGMDAQKAAYIQEWQTWMDSMNTQKTTYQKEWETWFAGIQNQSYVVGGMTITVGDTPPSNPIAKDIWIDTNA